MTKQYYLNRKFKEATIKCTPEINYALPHNIQAMRKQYGLQHYVAGTIHYTTGDTLPSLAICFSLINRKCSILDTGHLLVSITFRCNMFYLANLYSMH